MIVKIGQEIVGRDGKLGTLVGLSIDPNSQSADQMVIRHGFPLRQEHLAVLGLVTGVRDDVVQVDMDKKQLEASEQYDANAYRSDAPNYGLPSFDQLGSERQNYGMDQVIADEPNHTRSNSAVDETHLMPPTYPTGEQSVPEDKRLTVITQDTSVRDNAGDKVGSVQTLAVETTTGKPTRLALQRGFLSQPELVIPVDWIARLGPEGIELNVSKDQVEQARRET